MNHLEDSQIKEFAGLDRNGKMLNIWKHTQRGLV
jgi:hypothetical protein